MHKLPFTRYRAVHRLRFLWAVLSATGMHMKASVVKQIIREMGDCLHQATHEEDKDVKPYNYGEYTTGKLDDITWTTLDACYTLVSENVAFQYEGILINLSYVEGIAVLSMATDANGYTPIMEWTEEGATIVQSFPAPIEV